MKHEKMIRTAGILDTFAKVLGGILNAAGIVSVIFAGLVLVLGEKMYKTDSISLDLDFVKLYLSEEYRTVTGAMQAYTVIGLAVIAILCFTACFAVKQFGKILAPMKNGRPFDENVPVCLRKIAWTVLGGGAACEIAKITEQIILTKVYPIEEILSSAAVEKIEYAFTADFGFVIVFCVIMLLSCIFSYGCELQQESDETL